MQRSSQSHVARVANVTQDSFEAEVLKVSGPQASCRMHTLVCNQGLMPLVHPRGVMWLGWEGVTCKLVVGV